MVDGKNKCPNCGATLSGLELKCPECGYVFSKETESNERIRDAIESFQVKLSAIKKPSEKATAIGSFTLPNTVEGLIGLLEFAYSNFKRCNGLEEEIITSAWLEKSKQAYRTLSLQAASDKSILSRIERYASLDNARMCPKVLIPKSKKRRRSIIRWIIIIAAIIAAIYLFLLIVSSLDEPSSDTGVRQEVMELIEQKRYDEARIKAKELEYSWDQKELIDIIDKAEKE